MFTVLPVVGILEQAWIALQPAGPFGIGPQGVLGINVMQNIYTQQDPIVKKSELTQNLNDVNGALKGSGLVQPAQLNGGGTFGRGSREGGEDDAEMLTCFQ